MEIVYWSCSQMEYHAYMDTATYIINAESQNIYTIDYNYNHFNLVEAKKLHELIHQSTAIYNMVIPVNSSLKTVSKLSCDNTLKL